MSASLNEADLQLYRYDAVSGTWQAYSSTVDPETNLVTATLVTEFSTWVIGASGNGPTLVALRGIRAADSTLAWVGVLRKVKATNRPTLNICL